MDDKPAMTRGEVEELIHELSSQIGITEKLADDMLDAGHFISWAVHENNLNEEEAMEEINEIGKKLDDFIQEKREEGHDIDMICLTMWSIIQEVEERMRKSPTEETSDEDKPRDVMFR